MLALFAVSNIVMNIVSILFVICITRIMPCVVTGTK